MLRTLVTIREPGDEPIPLVIEDGRFADPDLGPIDREIDSAHLYALPGLSDCHAHLSASSIGAMLELTDDEVRRNSRRHVWMQVAGGVLLVQLTLDQRSPALGVPVAWVYAAVPIAGALMLFHVIAEQTSRTSGDD